MATTYRLLIKFSEPSAQRFWASVFVVFFVGIFIFVVSPVLAASTFFVAPNGNDSSDGSVNHPWKTLVQAQQYVRTINADMTDDISIVLSGGTYTLTAPLLLIARDSGTNGHTIHYRNVPNERPIINGGATIVGWVQDGNEWKANVPAGADFRQLYVNGQRAARSKGDQPLVLNRDYWPSVDGQGFYFPTINIDLWQNPTDIEFVSNNAWKQYRCHLSSVQFNVAIMQQPCWDNANRSEPSMKNNTVTYIENAKELLNRPGEWYLDKTNGVVYYKPFLHEQIDTTTFIRPLWDTFIEGTGVHNISFEGIAFEYAAWNRPSTAEGYASVQANTSYIGAAWNIEKAAANITFVSSSNITFTHNVFTHLGGAGLNFDTASHDNHIIGNHFTDISGNAVQIGDLDVSDPISYDNEVANNYIHDVATEYQDAVAIWFGYAKNALIINNEIFNLPYTGISLGWGWGNDDSDSQAGGNSVKQNYIYDHVQTLTDGGGIYTLSSQLDSTISGNVISNQGQAHGALYLDSGSRYFSVNQNVCWDNPESAFVKGGDNILQNNFWQDNNQFLYDPNPDLGPNTTEPNTVISSLTDAPANIISQAGLTSDYTPIKNLPYPTNLHSACDQYGTSVNLSWNTADHPTTYDLRFSDNTINKLSTTSTTKSVSCGQSYDWWVTNTDNTQDIPRDTFICPCNNAERPNAPDGIFLTSQATDSLGLMWSPSTDHYGLLRYDIYRDGVYIGYTANLFYLDSGLQPDTPYSYQVVAVDALQHRSEKGHILMASTGRLPTPLVVPALVPQILGIQDSIPTITPIALNQDIYKLKDGQRILALYPLGHGYRGKSWGRKIDLGRKGIYYIFIPLGTTKKIVVFDSHGKLTDALSLKSGYIDLSTDIDLQYLDDGKLVVLGFSTIPRGQVHLYSFTLGKLKKIHILPATGKLYRSPTVMFLRLTAKKLILVTMISGQRSSLRFWFYDKKKKKISLYSPSLAVRTIAEKKIAAYYSSAKK